MEPIAQRGTVTKCLKGNLYEVSLQDHPNHKVLAKPCGKMQKKRIMLLLGDEVKLELSPYDLTKWRIVWRY